tara:strand:+ start:1454 stop:1855 length:402 start_codon:yes stop_codon:yes gene_type:complete
MIGLISAVLPAVTDIVGRFLPEDKEERAKAERAIKAQLTEHLAKVDLAQIDVNKEEAKGNWFQSSWRPLTGWTCAASLAWTYLLQPMASFVLAQTGHLVDLPALDMSQMMPILLGMLGLGGLRSWERTKGVSK